VTCHLWGSIHAQEIHPSHLPGKESIAGKEHPWRAVGIVEQIAHAAQRVSGGVDGPHLEPPDPPRLAVLRRLAVLIVQHTVGVPDLRPGARDQLQRPDQIILVPVGFQDVSDAHPRSCGRLGVHVHVAPGINDDGLSLVADEVGIMGQSLRFDSFK